MRLAPREIEKLILHQAGLLAQQRYARGLRLNYAEAMALIASQLLELIRDGASVASLMDKGKQILGLDDVMEGVAGMIEEVQVEGTFPDGTKLITVHHPVCREAGDPGLALYGSGLARTRAAWSPDNASAPSPGEQWVEPGSIELNAGRPAVRLEVTNLGDRPIQVGSHYPFFETNPALSFDRSLAWGRRLDIPSGTAVRFEPGETKRVELVGIDGERIIRGGNALTDGIADEEHKARALAALAAGGFANKTESETEGTR